VETDITHAVQEILWPHRFFIQWEAAMFSLTFMIWKLGRRHFPLLLILSHSGNGLGSQASLLGP